VVLEHALLSVPAERTDDFIAAFTDAVPLISASPGFVSLRLERCIEDATRFLLLVEWERLEDHSVGFRQSPAYDEWRSRLHHFYDPFPVVEHFAPVLGA
jgi:heme-degrading monooxygenase HmoA